MHSLNDDSMAVYHIGHPGPTLAANSAITFKGGDNGKDEDLRRRFGPCAADVNRTERFPVGARRKSKRIARG